jgi:hypothetical protein
MNPRQTEELRQRVVRAAETCLEHDGSVGPLELLQQMGMLYPRHVADWKKGSPHYTPLEPHIQCGAEKLERTFAYFIEWTRQRGLTPIEASFVRTGPRGSDALQVTVDGDPELERFFRTHYAVAELSERKTARLREKLSKPADLIVYQLVSPTSKCNECETELHKGQCLFLEHGQPLCLACADLDHLEFLPSGDAALTRRARKHSSLAAVVVRFSRSRKRYERQGILVTSEALAQAEQECQADAAERAARRERDADSRLREDRALVEAMTRLIAERYPNCPAAETARIASHTALRNSGRIGRSAGGRALEPEAIDLAVAAWARHQHTNYDELLMQGTERLTARAMIRSRLERMLGQWSRNRR